MAYIYKITNDINGKVYVGWTSFSIEQRFKLHLSDATKGSMRHRPLYSAIQKYGKEHFHIEIVEETTEPQEREQYWIAYYDSYQHGYNATLGGEGRLQYDHDKIYNLFLEGKGVQEICEIVGCEVTICNNLLKARGITKEERIQRGKDKQIEKYGKPVAKLDKETGEILDVFLTIAAASESIQKPRRHIAEVCKEKRKSAYGYKWEFITKEEYDNYKNSILL